MKLSSILKKSQVLSASGYKMFKSKKDYLKLLENNLKREHGVEYPKLMILDNEKIIDWAFNRDKNIIETADELMKEYKDKPLPSPRKKNSNMLHTANSHAFDVVEDVKKELEKIKTSFLHIKKLYDLKFQHPTRPPDFLDLVKGTLKNIEPPEMKDLFEDGDAADMANLIQRLIWAWEEVEGELKDGFEEYSRYEGPDEDDKEYERWAGK